MTEDLDAIVEKMRAETEAEIQAEREASDKRLAEIIARFEARGGKWKPRNPAGNQARDYKNAQAGDR